MKNIIIILFVVSAGCTFGQGSVWVNVSGDKGLAKFEQIETTHLRLDKQLLNAKLAEATFTITIPYPEGALEKFTVKEASIMQSNLQKKYPTIRTYKGVSASGEVLRMDVTPNGFHAIAFTKKGTVYIDPSDLESSEYVSYYRLDYKKTNTKTFEEKWEEQASKLLPGNAVKRRTRARVNGTELKSYRVAIAADNAYTTFHGGTVVGALSAIVTTLNRVTGIYENELAITFVLVDGNDEIIYTRAATDPYDGLDAQGAINENQSNLDNVIGTANYDIGHVFTTGSGGLAGLGVVCNSSSKALGTTGTSEPTGDPFDVDFVAHEIGHQFGANHTFNGTAGNCTGGNRNGSTAYEPGSGTTIMAYAGICGGDNIQNNSDAYFHAASLEEILDYVSNENGATCPEISDTGNTPPVAEAPTGGFTIPVNTPFSLTATGFDPDGDELTYAWEQYDLGNAGSPSNPSATAPLFRSFSPVESPTRYFPALDDVVSGNTTLGEVLPDVSRELTFKITVRDNNPNGGGINDDEVSFNVSDEAGPFLVTSQSEAETLAGGSSQLVTWDVANTNNSPVSVDSVAILISLDGGESFSDTLIRSTLNDGGAFITLPNEEVAEARLMVAALENIFFNVNEADFSIEETGETTFDLMVSEVPATSCEDRIDLTIEAVAINGFSDEIDLSFSSTEMVSFEATATHINIGERVVLSITNEEGLGEKAISITGTSNSLTTEQNTIVSFLDDIEQAPNLVFPQNGETGIGLRPNFVWNEVEGATAYDFILATDEEFENLVAESVNQPDTTYDVSTVLDANMTYYWQVTAVNKCGEGPSTNQQAFSTLNLSAIEHTATDIPVNILDLSTVKSSIIISEDVIVFGVSIQNLDVTHTWVSDLTVTLTSPEGTTVTLFDRACSDNEDVFLTFDDHASSTLVCPPNDGGSYIPSEELSSFFEESSRGEWVLSINDAANQDQGALNGWGIVITTETTIDPTPSAPSNLVASRLGANEILIAWTDNSDSENGFLIQRRVDNENFAELVTIAADETSYTDDMVERGTEYFYQVVAFNSGGESEPSNVASLLVLGLTEISREIYPNPAQDQVVISNEVSFDEIQLIDLFGRTVIQVVKKTEGPSIIDISSLDSGIYVLMIVEGDEQKKVKLIKR